MSERIKLAEEFFSQIAGVKARNVELGHGSFITMDFGKDILITSIKTMRTRRQGEWFLWIYRCAWRLDHKGQPVVGASDSRDFIESKLPHLEGKKFLYMKITSNSFDCRLEFDENWSLLLFSHGVQEDEQWMFLHLITGGYLLQGLEYVGSMKILQNHKMDTEKRMETSSIMKYFTRRWYGDILEGESTSIRDLYWEYIENISEKLPFTNSPQKIRSC